MKSYIIYVIFLVLVTAQISSGQQIQWASGVVNETNAYSSGDWSASSVLGAPDAMPYGELNPKAFRLKTEKATGSLILSYDKPQKVKQVIILESYMPARIERVYLYDENKNRYSIFADGYVNDEPFSVLSIPVNNVSGNITQVEIRLNTTGRPGWAQIDAVGITDSDDPSIGKRVLQSIGEDERLEILSQTETRRNLGLHVNSVYDEVKPIVSVDGKKLFFSRQYAPTNLGGEKDELDIYYSDLVNGSWTEAKNIGSPLNNLNPNGVTSTTADGRYLLLINQYNKDGTNYLGLSITENNFGRWQTPRKVNIEGFVNLNQFVDFSLSANGDVLIMAIETKDSYGDQDLYVSFYKGNDTWTAPKNLGPILNTKREEFSPFIAPDGITLYFASAGHGGLGDSDIFYTRRLDDTWLNWSPPVNLGPTVNTPGFDGYFSIAANTDIAYVVSKTGGRAGSRDIYQVRIPPEAKPRESYMLIGNVYDAQTRLPVANADVTISGTGDTQERANLLKTGADGSYAVMLSKNGDFEATVGAAGYETKTEDLLISEEQKGQLEVRNDFFLEPSKVMEPLVASTNNAPLITSLPEYTDKEAVKVFEEEPKVYNLHFKVLDAVTQEEISHSRLVFGLNSPDMEEPLLKDNGKLASYSQQMTMDESTIYLKAEAAGYYSESRVIPPSEWKNREDKEFIIYLNPIPSATAQLPATSEATNTTAPFEAYDINGITSKPRIAIMEVSGNVYDAVTRKPISASVSIKSTNRANRDQLKANPQGYFKVRNPDYVIYDIEITHSGYYTKTEFLDVSREIGSNGIARVAYYLTPIEVGEKVTLNNLWFVQSQAILVDFSFPVLDSLGQVLLDNPTLEIKISGHTDGIGDQKKNQYLSEERVAVIKEYLVNLGIHPKRIQTEAFGGRFPIASNAREETRRLNRRVEVTILKY
jgi:outer membrane protein OmpA-like peptidoglycan-associated protein